MPNECYKGSWHSFIPLMEECAEKNGVIEIDISDAEYERLLNGGLEELKGRVSENLASRLTLLEGSLNVPSSLLVAHYGCCL